MPQSAHLNERAGAETEKKYKRTSDAREQTEKKYGHTERSTYG